MSRLRKVDLAERFNQRAEQGGWGWKEKLLVGGTLAAVGGYIFRIPIVARVGVIAAAAGAAIWAADKIRGKQSG